MVCDDEAVAAAILKVILWLQSDLLHCILLFTYFTNHLHGQIHFVPGSGSKIVVTLQTSEELQDAFEMADIMNRVQAL
jgi:hypothetical protein